jgi:hypothetical protein
MYDGAEDRYPGVRLIARVNGAKVRPCAVMENAATT